MIEEAGQYIVQAVEPGVEIISAIIFSDQAEECIVTVEFLIMF